MWERLRTSDNATKENENDRKREREKEKKSDAGSFPLRFFFVMSSSFV